MTYYFCPAFRHTIQVHNTLFHFLTPDTVSILPMAALIEANSKLPWEQPQSANSPSSERRV